MFCSHCGKVISNSSKFCGHCGAVTESSTGKSETTQNVKSSTINYNQANISQKEAFGLREYWNWRYGREIESKINDVNYFESTDFLTLLHQAEIELKEYREEYLVGRRFLICFAKIAVMR